MTSILRVRRLHVLALAFAFTCTGVSFSSTLELFNHQPGGRPAELHSLVQITDL